MFPIFYYPGNVGKLLLSSFFYPGNISRTDVSYLLIILKTFFNGGPGGRWAGGCRGIGGSGAAEPSGGPGSGAPQLAGGRQGGRTARNLLSARSTSSAIYFGNHECI